jgi:transketolase
MSKAVHKSSFPAILPSDHPAHDGALYAQMAHAIRVLAMDAVEHARSGHPGMPMGMADVATVLFSEYLRFDPKNPQWPGRDRFVLSAGHGSMLLYALLYLTGYEAATIEQLKKFRQLGSLTAGHPEYGHMPGVETTTGPLGQGIATAVGMALAERLAAAKFMHLTESIVDYRTYVIAGDGCLMEGLSQEAITLAGHWCLSKLTVLFDDNQISIDGPTSLATSEDTLQRFVAAGWDVRAINGHDVEEIRQALAWAGQCEKPSLIACRTKIACYAPTKVGTAASHGSPLGDTEIAGARKAMGWQDEPFIIPQSVLSGWRLVGERNRSFINQYEDKIRSLTDIEQSLWSQFQHQSLPEDWDMRCKKMVDALSASTSSAEATRKSSGRVLAHLTDWLPFMIGGSADLTGSNDTKVKQLSVIQSDNFSGRYIHYGVREHGMGSIMNGLALSGFIPYGGTFLVFSDYCRPAIRLSALMGLRVVYVMTHDSIGLGEDGPTHQPVEHIASLRAMPNLLVLRPADVIETAWAWQVAIEHRHTPSILALSRQNLPLLDRSTSDLAEAHSTPLHLGAYLLESGLSDSVVDVALYASGSEVMLAVEAAARLRQEYSYNVRVISVPCMELYSQQSASYRQQLDGNARIRVGIEAGVRQGWDALIGHDGLFVGMDGFGASAPAEQLYAHFGISVSAIIDKVQKRLLEFR